MDVEGWKWILKGDGKGDPIVNLRQEGHGSLTNLQRWLERV